MKASYKKLITVIFFILGSFAVYFTLEEFEWLGIYSVDGVGLSSAEFEQRIFLGDTRTCLDFSFIPRLSSRRYQNSLFYPNNIKPAPEETDQLLDLIRGYTLTITDSSDSVLYENLMKMTGLDIWRTKC